MRHLLLVLIQTLARFFRGCADVLSALGRTADPAVGEQPAAAAFTGRTAAPPNDWLRRANPPPPAHWLEVVRRRAPGFLGEAARTPIVRPLQKQPVIAEPSLRPSASQPIPETEAAVRERTSLPAATLPPKSARGSEPPKARVPRSVRIVTVVEESPRRKPAEVQPAKSDAGAGAARDSFLSEDPVSKAPPGRMSQAFVLPLRERFVEPPVTSESDREFVLPQDDHDWQPLLRPATAAPIVPSVPGSAVIPALESPEGILRLPVPEGRAFSSMPGRSERRESPSFPAEAPRWPDLPASAESDDLDDARILYRELRRQAVLEDEQRGMPWSA